MLRHLWTTKLGVGCIDVSICPKSGTIAIADISRGLILTDLASQVITEQHIAYPAWGVDHRVREDGRLVIAVAAASKDPSAGRVAIFLDDERVVDYEIGSPAWDAIILGDNTVAASSWNGKSFLWNGNLQGEPSITEISKARPVFGLTPSPKGGYYANLERDGLYEVTPDYKRAKKLIDLKTNAYNLALSEDGTIIASGGYGPSISIYDTSSKKVTAIPGNEVRAVAFVDNVLFIGEAGGAVTGWAASAPDAPLLSFDLGADVWAIAHARDLKIVAFALGDGRVACFEPAFDPVDLQGIPAAAKVIKAGKPGRFGNIFGRTRLIDPFVRPMLGWLLDGEECPEPELDTFEGQFKRAVGDLRQPSDAYGLIEAAILGRRQRHLECRRKLQDIDQGSPWYPTSVLMLAQNLSSTGDKAAAARLLAANENVVAPLIGPTARSTKGGGRPLLPMQPPPAVDIADQSLIIFSQKPQRKKTKRVSYGIINYVKYEFPSNSDAAKKNLEHAEVVEIVASEFQGRYSGLRSLDIGCATCRYPLWFESLGFISTGYDIDESAIEICRRRAAGNQNIRIAQTNILQSQPDLEAYDVVTCMMGTFNHFSAPDQKKVFAWCLDSLKPRGLFIFSAWNKECPYLSLLDFYNRDARESLSRNLQTLDQTRRAITQSEFLIEAVRPTAFLHSACYDAWVGRIPDDAIIQIARQLRSTLPENEAQLIVFVARKP